MWSPVFYMTSLVFIANVQSVHAMSTSSAFSWMRSSWWSTSEIIPYIAPLNPPVVNTFIHIHKLVYNNKNYFLKEGEWKEYDNRFCTPNSTIECLFVHNEPKMLWTSRVKWLRMYALVWGKFWAGNQCRIADKNTEFTHIHTGDHGLAEWHVNSSILSLIPLCVRPRVLNHS